MKISKSLLIEAHKQGFDVYGYQSVINKWKLNYQDVKEQKSQVEITDLDYYDWDDDEPNDEGIDFTIEDKNADSSIHCYNSEEVEKKLRELLKNQKQSFRYYSIHRPIDIGTIPMSPKPDKIVNFEEGRKSIGNFMAWGYVEYSQPLEPDLADDYELRQK